MRAANGELRERSVAQLSGGEKKRAALALGLAFTMVAAARGRLTTNLLVLDEVGSCVCCVLQVQFVQMVLGHAFTMVAAARGRLTTNPPHLVLDEVSPLCLHVFVQCSDVKAAAFCVSSLRSKPL